MKVMNTKEQLIEVGDIKPCPFCGELDDLTITDAGSYGDLVEAHGSSLISINCRKCDLEKKLYRIPGNNYMLGLGILITKWNTRL